MTRLSGRLFSLTPSGIDRMDYAYAKNFVRQDGAHAVNLSLLGPALFDARVSGAVLDNIEHGWDDGDRSARQEDRFAVLRRIERWLNGDRDSATSPAVARIRARGPKRDLGRALSAYAGLAFRGRSLARQAPQNALYLNVSQFPLWSAAYVRWLRARPDIACVAMIHDLLPLQFPEYFIEAEQDRQRRRLAFLAQRGTGVIVSTSVVKRELANRLKSLGRSDLPIHVAHLPVDETFEFPVAPEGRIETSVPYFVTYGTIEPRKNHLMLLQLWREMAAAAGKDAPRLIVVGKRGWENESVFRLFDRSIGLSDHVLEVNGMSTFELRHLLAGARALLVPSLAEGFGLPIAEGRAAGVPLIASDIPVFREIGGPDIAYVHPLDAPAWERAIGEAMRGGLKPPAPGGMSRDSYFTGVEGFLSDL